MFRITRSLPGAAADYTRAVRKPPITITCDCGTVGRARYGETWRCEECGQSWSTSQIPAQEYEALLRGVRKYRLLALAPPVTFAAVLVPLAIMDGIRFALLLFMLVLAHALLVMPAVRRRVARHVRASTVRWKLRPD